MGFGLLDKQKASLKVQKWLLRNSYGRQGI